MNNKSLSTLEYNKIISRLVSFACSDGAKQILHKLEPMTEQKYDLYTEKIVLSPKVKYKNLIRTIKILILIIIAGVVYIAADKLIVPSVKAKFERRKQNRIELNSQEMNIRSLLLLRMKKDSHRLRRIMIH